MYCGCFRVLSAREALRDIGDEAQEWFAEPSLDEFSDVMWGVGRLIGGLCGVEYVRVPGDRRHAEKISARMAEYGCVRSKRHLVEGVCPSGGE
jgi:hypothetical protein